MEQELRLAPRGHLSRLFFSDGRRSRLSEKRSERRRPAPQQGWLRRHGPPCRKGNRRGAKEELVLEARCYSGGSDVDEMGLSSAPFCRSVLKGVRYSRMCDPDIIS